MIGKLWREHLLSVLPSRRKSLSSFLFFLFILYLCETMDVSCTYCHKHFTIYVNQTIMVYALNSYSIVCQLFLNKTGDKKCLRYCDAWLHPQTGWYNKMQPRHPGIRIFKISPRVVPDATIVENPWHSKGQKGPHACGELEGIVMGEVSRGQPQAKCPYSEV